MTRILALMSVMALMVAAMAMPAMAAPVITGGLVNVTLTDVVDANNNVVVQLPVGVAANVCDVNAAVLLGAIEDNGNADCEATSTAVANAPGNRSNNR